MHKNLLYVKESTCPIADDALYIKLLIFAADDNQTARLCSALKILVETERQLRSPSSTQEDQTSGILAALIEIASQDTIFPRRSITLPSGINFCFLLFLCL